MYCHEYGLDPICQHVSAHGINVIQDGEFISSAIILCAGGATGIHERSIAYDGVSLYVAAGDSLYSLSLPKLKLNWHKKVDFAACFSVYWLPARNCLITWGEVDIGCYSKEGAEKWSTSGPDIFAEGFKLEKDNAVITDFNGDIFKVNLDNGIISNGSV